MEFDNKEICNLNQFIEFILNNHHDGLEISQQNLKRTIDLFLSNSPTDIKYSEFYEIYKLKKKRGGFRYIFKPNPTINYIHRVIYSFLARLTKPHPKSFGFLKGVSVKNNAINHVNKNVILNIDLKDFFGSITYKLVYDAISTSLNPIKVSDNDLKDISDLITKICTITEIENNTKQNQVESIYSFLPQGTVTSPYISNIVCYRLDTILSEIADRYNVIYSRYADDLTFSSNNNIFNRKSSFRKEVKNSLLACGFEINPGKVNILYNHNRQTVNGVVVNKKVNFSRDSVKRLRYYLYLIEHYGKSKANAIYLRYVDNSSHLKMGGKGGIDLAILSLLAQMANILGSNNPRYIHYKSLFNEIAGRFNKNRTFAIAPNVLFAGTFPKIDPVVGSEKGIDNQPDKVKRVVTYLNCNNLKDGNHSVLVASGQSIGDTSTDDNAKSVKIVVGKKNPDGKIQPVDVNGNFITLEEVYEKGIFQEAPLPERFSSVESLFEGGKYAVKDSKSTKANGEISIPTTKEKVDREVARYKAWYEKVSKDVMVEGYVSKSHTILKVTQGVNLKRTDKSSAPTRESLHKSIGKGDYKLHIGTNENTTLFSGAKVKLNPGYVYLEDLKSGNIFQLQTNKLTNTQQETVIQLLKTFVSNFTIQEDGKISMEGAGNYMGKNIFKDGIDNIIYFQDRNNITKEGREKLYNLVDRINEFNLSIFRFIENPEVEAAGLAEAERKLLIKEYYAIKEGLNREYQINSNPKTQFYFLDHPDIPGGLVVIGGEKEGKILPLLDQTDIKTKTLNPEVETALREFLPQRNMNVVKSKKKLNNDDPFTTLVYENGELVYKTYETYNDYVIDNTTTESLEYGEDANSTVGKKIVFEVLEEDSKIPPSPKTDKFNDEPDFQDVDIDELRKKAVSSGKGMNPNDMLKNKKHAVTDKDAMDNPPNESDFPFKEGGVNPFSKL